MLIDTHCQLNLMVKKDFNRALTTQEIADTQRIIDEAHSHDVDRIVTIASNFIESENCLRLANTYPTVFATVGIHPCDCTPDWKNEFEQIKNLFALDGRHKIVGIGEIGLDFYWPGFDKQLQKDVLNAQVEFALKHDLPFVLHARNAHEELLIELQKYQDDFADLNRPSGVMHCFSYDKEYADAFTSLGFMLGLGGIITYPKNNDLRNVIKTLDMKHIVLETDAPFLPPQPIRGKPNHPEQIATIAQYLADLRGTTLKDIAEQTTANAQRLFKLS